MKKRHYSSQRRVFIAIRRSIAIKLSLIFTESTWKKLSRNQTVSLLPSILIGVAIWFGATPNEELTLTAIHLLAVFIRLAQEQRNS